MLLSAQLAGFLNILTFLSNLVGATFLFEGATIIAWNDTTESLQVLQNASMLIEKDRITALSEGALAAALPANTAYKTIASNTSLAEYYQRYGEFSQAIEHFTPEDLYVGQLTGALELLYSGVTTVVDHAHASWSDETVDACVNASFDSGIRAFYAHTIHPLPIDYTWEEQIAKLQALAAESRFAQNDPSSIVSLGLSWDSFYTGEQENITELWNITQASNLSVVTTHYLGGPFAYANSPTALHQYGWLNSTVPIIFSHSSFMDWTDANLLRQTNQYISTTPESELHFGHNHPYAHLIQDQASIGVDCHFTYSSSMVQQARLWLQTLRWPNYLDTLENFQVPRNNPMSVDQAFDLITRSGGLALRRKDLGVIKVGAKADINVFKTDAPNMIGWSKPVAAIILHSGVGDIEDVLVDGKFVKKNGQMLYPDYSTLSQKLTASAQKIQGVWAMTAWPALTGELGPGSAPYGYAEVIDTERGEGTGY